MGSVEACKELFLFCLEIEFMGVEDLDVEKQRDIVGRN
jgi:hypothetical protein